jgi:hypothetical protein
VGTLAKGAFGEMLSKGYDKLAGAAYDEMAKQVAQRMFEHGRTMDETHATLADNRLAVERLTKQMVATTMLKTGLLDDTNLKGQTFATGTPPRIKPFAEMTPQEYSDFLEWAQDKGGTNDVFDRFRNTFRTTSDVNDYLGLQVPASSGGDG